MLNTIKMYSLTAQEAGSLKSRRGQGGFLLEALRENLPLASLLAAGGWHSLACGCITPISVSVFSSVSLCLLLFCLL